ncbi:MAG: hypothetical protein GWN00_19670 [Aliifodinibius sp.]|nr:hypothetical protein [candidate division Zixibacteria bacterium]NIT58358.1 hypothetical protein [Fodinibius sp.]NIW42398.1 hypothetical protein [candidate division Zixibacteria bacterium]NIX57163.1 hypothetical protein [candidate division Zixibacteria bacterium]NIY26941.1 hypothetical protein [Fodinibius sp.]
MSEKIDGSGRGDELDARKGPSEGWNLDQEVRSDAVARARANIETGHYEEPEVVNEIVDRLIEQFGL